MKKAPFEALSVIPLESFLSPNLENSVKLTTSIRFKLTTCSA